MELPPIWRGWDLGLELADDVGAADWVVAAVRPWERPRGGSVWVASFVPDSFEAYARILHPARGRNGDVRWAELATRRGVDVGPDTGFCAASGLDPTRDQRAWQDVVPSDGSLPERQLAALGAALAPFTTTPDECVFCFWVGYGFFGEPLGVPVVRVPNRDHYLFTGPLVRTRRAVRFDVLEQSPSMWWPADRAWFVATEVDGYSTYVGGTATCVERILACPALEALTVTVEASTDPGPYA